MSTRDIEDDRIRILADAPVHRGGRYVLHWMQASQRAGHNPALELAAQRANEHGLPLVVAATVVPDYPMASARHFAFMLGGLVRALGAVRRRGARPCLRVGPPADTIGPLCSDAAEVVLDRGYLRHQRRWYRELADGSDRRITQVEGDVVVPIDLASDGEESAARTIRPKIAQHRDRFLVDLDTTPIDVHTTPNGTTSDLDIDDLHSDSAVVAALADLGLDGSPDPVDWLTPGTRAARLALTRFLDDGDDYESDRNRYTDPDGTSGLSPYLHHGQISPVEVALRASERLGDDAEPFLEELVVRRELAVNHVARNADHGTWSGLPDWARRTLEEHADDERDHRYTAGELERGETHDELWNAIMGQIRERGWVHNQLRMYWGKQVVLWTNTPQHAFRTLVELNDRYFLDGRDPSSYANVGWCFGLHDRPFQERPVSGKVRPFTDQALRRKDDLDAWLEAHA